MKRRFSLFVLFFISALFVLSGCKKKDQNTISGHVSYIVPILNQVKDAPNAKVYLVSGGDTVKTVYADYNGNYVFYPVPDGNYSVVAKYEHKLFTYFGQSKNVDVQGEQKVNLDLDLVVNENAIVGGVMFQQQTLAGYKVYLFTQSQIIDSTYTNQSGIFYFRHLQNGTYGVFAYYMDNNGNEYCDLQMFPFTGHSVYYSILILQPCDKKKKAKIMRIMKK